MKTNVIIVLAVISLMLGIYWGCVKQNDTMQITNSKTENKVETISNIPLEKRTVEEQVRDYNDKLAFAFHVEGNFTNSGNREILAFYQWKDSQYYSIVASYCFICDSKGEEIMSIYKLPNYGTLFDSDSSRLSSMPMESLGKEVYWLNQRFGYIGDFNENNREELYFYELSGMAFIPRFFEFNGDGFKEILGFPLETAYITEVNADTKEITFRSVVQGKGIELATYRWDNEMQKYVVVSTD